MSTVLEDSIGADGDSESDIIKCLKKLKRPVVTKHNCLPPPPKLPPAKKFTAKCFCPRRTEELALPKAYFLEGTLQYFCHRLEPERVLRIVKMIHELHEPRPKGHFLMKRKKRKKRKSPKKLSKEEERKRWLDNQADITAHLLIQYLRSKGRYTPNYKQLQVAMYLNKRLKFKRQKDVPKMTRRALCTLIQQFAVIFDIKCEPYKRELAVAAKARSPVPDEDMKHVVFRLGDFDFGTEYSFEGEEGDLGKQLLEEFKEMGEFEEEGEGFGFGFGLYQELEEAARKYGEGEGEGIEIGPYGLEIEGYGEGEEGLGYGIKGEGEERGEGGEGEEVFGILGEEAGELEGEEGMGEKMGIYGEEMGEMGEGWGAFGVQEAGYETEEEIMGIAGEELPCRHTPSTSSYVSWCLYCSWLDEFSKNIIMYGGCLKRFRECLAKDGAAKHNEILSYILQNWSKYLAEATRVDLAMVEYFKNKPIIKCSCCRPCTIYDYPKDHEIPEELIEAIETTKKWKKLLEEAEKYCKAVVCPDVIEEVPSAETIEILDVVDSSSSGFSIEEVVPPRSLPSCSKRLSKTEKKKK